MKKSKNNKLNINNLAIFGGSKSINFKKPHWKWPPKSSGKNKAIKNYYKNEKYNRYGYPQIVEDFEKAFAKFHNSKYSLTTNS